MEFINYIKPELLLVAVICYVIGMILKKTSFKDNYIPLVVGLAGIVICIIYCGFVEGWSFDGTVTGAVQGLLCAAASTYINQVIKQLAKNHNVDVEVIEEVIEALKGDDKDD